MNRAPIRLLCSAFLCAVSLAANRAWSEPQPAPIDTVISAPDWRTGSTWYYSDGYGVKVSSSAGGITTFDRLDAPGQWFSRQGFLRKDLVSGTATRNSIYRTMSDQSGAALSARTPLTFEREYLSNGQLVVHASSWTVEGRETITVPAGTFDCWIIVWRTRSLKSDWTGFERWWYSPQAQNYVRLEYKYGPAESGSRVLMRYTLGQQRAAEAKPEADSAPASPPSAVSDVTASSTPKDVPSPNAGPDIAVAALPALNPVLPQEPVPTPSAEQPRTNPVIEAGPAKPSPVSFPPRSPASPKGAFTSSQDASGTVWRVQLASSKDQAALQASFEKLQAAWAAKLGDLPSGITAAQVRNRGTFYRAWVGAFPSPRTAAAFCTRLKADGHNCTVIPDHAGENRLAAGEQQLQSRR